MSRRTLVVDGVKYVVSIGDNYVKMVPADASNKPVGKPTVVGIDEVLSITIYNLERLRWKNPGDPDLAVTPLKLTKYIRGLNDKKDSKVL